MSGEDPKFVVVVGGLKWFPKGYFIMLNTGELNFNKKVRGKKSEDNVGVNPKYLSNGIVLGKTLKFFIPREKLRAFWGGGGHETRH